MEAVCFSAGKTQDTEIEFSIRAIWLHQALSENRYCTKREAKYHKCMKDNDNYDVTDGQWARIRSGIHREERAVQKRQPDNAERML